jgi:hypothetical protein
VGLVEVLLILLGAALAMCIPPNILE